MPAFASPFDVSSFASFLTGQSWDQQAWPKHLLAVVVVRILDNDNDNDNDNDDDDDVDDDSDGIGMPGVRERAQ